MFQIRGGVGAHAPVSIVPWFKAKAKVSFKQQTVLQKPVTRYERGPVYYKDVHVVYDKAKGKMKLPPGTFAHRAVGEEDDTEDSETVLAFDDEENDLAGKHIHGLSHQVGDNC